VSYTDGKIPSVKLLIKCKKRKIKENISKDSPYIPINSTWEDLKQERIERVRVRLWEYRKLREWRDKNELPAGSLGFILCFYQRNHQRTIK